LIMPGFRGENFSREIEQKEKPKRIVLEIGVGSAPHFLNVDLRRSELGTHNDFYIGVDLEKQSARVNKEQIDEHFVDGQAVVADGQSLPFKDASVDEVIFNNILNANIILKGQRGGSVNPNRQKNTIKRKVEWLAAGKRILLEGLRVLKPQGKILILEYNLGEHSSAENQEIYDEILKLVESTYLHGFKPIILKREVYDRVHHFDHYKVLEVNYVKQKPPKK